MELDWKKQAEELSGKGFSGRQIAKIIGKSKSAINDHLKSLREGRRNDFNWDWYQHTNSVNK